jgi:hypothetical protein
MASGSVEDHTLSGVFRMVGRPIFLIGHPAYSLAGTRKETVRKLLALLVREPELCHP